MSKEVENWIELDYTDLPKTPVFTIDLKPTGNAKGQIEVTGLLCYGMVNINDQGELECVPKAKGAKTVRCTHYKYKSK